MTKSPRLSRVEIDDKMMMPTLTSARCATRRNRLLALMESQRVDVSLLSDVRDIYYFTGTLLPADLPALWLAHSDGSCRLIGPEGYSDAEIQEMVTYDWNCQGTRHPDLPQKLQEVTQGFWKSLGSKRVAFQKLSLLDNVRAQISAEADCQWIAIDESIAKLQQLKDADEVEIIRASIQANLGAYEAVRMAIHPGATELDVLAAGIQGAMASAGEKVFHDGDYQCGEYNGPARNRSIEAGELYIVDAWTCFRGYWADMSRTFVVGREPTDVQQNLFKHIRWIQSEIPGLLRPGVDGIDLFRALDEMIRLHPPLADVGLIHHGGHATGLRAQELPDINRDRGGCLEPGHVVCVEPGGYFAEARLGVRLENIYLLNENGCEDLCPGEVELYRCG
ncbi:MAG: Xaa-Pro peptidase family protein [Pirellulales bacterium]